jgi:hypothetical protein
VAADAGVARKLREMWMQVALGSVGVACDERNLGERNKWILARMGGVGYSRAAWINHLRCGYDNGPMRSRYIVSVSPMALSIAGELCVWVHHVRGDGTAQWGGVHVSPATLPPLQANKQFPRVR